MVRTADHDARRRQCADAFYQVAATASFDAVSLPKVAARAGVSVGLVQRYFPSKDTLLEYAVRALSEKLRARARLTASSGLVGDQLLAALGSLLPLDEERRDEAGVWLAIAARANAHPRLARIQAEGNAEVRAACVAALRLARERDEIRVPVDPEHDGAALAAFVDGLWWHMVNDPVAVDADLGVRLLAGHLGRLLTMSAE